jgi:hypothetical protein
MLHVTVLQEIPIDKSLKQEASPNCSEKSPYRDLHTFTLRAQENMGIDQLLRYISKQSGTEMILADFK